ncbi:EamA family transporter [Salinisphaera hydrothermalis]|uniref:EamA family transporter n=1 Tax=Salinisphaera hydrothermalis TaxID=563188 RepID=UPI0022B40884|nr:EamA family transporter [Salinisphaera hydrothermalis]
MRTPTRRSHETSTRLGTRPGVIEGLISGAGFALLFVALDRTANGAGFWPLVSGMSLGSVLVLPFALKGPRPQAPDANAIGMLIAAGIFGGGGNLCFIAATGAGQLSIVVVLTALYPAITILLARVALGERWNRAQAAGLVAAAAAVTLITLG